MKVALTETIKELYLQKYSIDISSFIEDEYLYLNEDNDIKTYHGIKPGDSEFYINLYKKLHASNDKFEFNILKNKDFSHREALEVGPGLNPTNKSIVFKDYESIDFAFNNATFKDDILNLKSTIKKDFDDILCFQVIEHVKDPKSLLLDLKSYLKEEGTLYLSFPNNDSYKKDEINSLTNIPPHHLHLFTVKSMSLLLEACGYKVKHIHYEQVNIRPYLYNYINKKILVLLGQRGQRFCVNKPFLLLSFLFKVILYPLKFIGAKKYNGHTILMEVCK